MSEFPLVSFIALLGWLILAGSALASYRLSWGKLAQMSLTWIAIFLGVFVLFSLIAGGMRVHSGSFSASSLFYII